MPEVLLIGSDTELPGASSIKAHMQSSYMQMAYNGSRIKLYSYPQTTAMNFNTHINAHAADVIHIACHGSGADLWIKANEVNADVVQVTRESLAPMLAYDKDKVVYIDACQSADLAKALHEDERLRVRLAIGHEGNISTTGAYLGARSFHSQLSRGTTYEEAFATLKSTVLMIDGTDRVRDFKDDEFIKTTLVPRPAQIVARFARPRDFGRNGNNNFRIEFGAEGMHTDSRCVLAFFSDDGTLTGGDYATVYDGFPKHGLVWTNNFARTEKDDEVWKVDGNFVVYMSYVQDDNYQTVKSTLEQALISFYFSGRFPHSNATQARAREAIDSMRSG